MENEQKRIVASYDYVGWIENIAEGKYGMEVKCRSDKLPSTTDWQQKVLFEISHRSKSYESIKASGISIGDKVSVKFIPSLNEGISKATRKVYAINKNMLVAISVLERGEPQPASVIREPDDLPF